MTGIANEVKKGLTYVLGAQKNGLIETVLLTTRNIIIMLWLRNDNLFFGTNSYLMLTHVQCCAYCIVKQ